MNERFFLKLLLGLFCGLAAAELLAAALFGLKTELILFIFVVAAALCGIVVAAALLGRRADDIESVSMRRSRAMRDDTLKDRFRGYNVDEEFLPEKNVKAERNSFFSGNSPTPDDAFLEQAIRNHAPMHGGLEGLLEKMESIEDAAFEKLAKEAGIGGLSRKDIICRLRLMVSLECEESPNKCGRALDIAMEAFSADRASFDDYIRRSMSSGSDSMDMDAGGDAGFSVQLDAAELSKTGGTMPEEFSHDPKAVIERLKQKGRAR
jgi:hypothetical protein